MPEKRLDGTTQAETTSEIVDPSSGNVLGRTTLQTRRDLNEARLAEVDVWRQAITEHWVLTLALGLHPLSVATPPN